MTKKLSKFLIFLMTLTIFCFFVTTSTNAQERSVIDSGECGATGYTINWTLFDDGELVISGEGEMSDTIPWVKYRSKIESLIINEGITKMGKKAFYMCNISKVSLPSTLTNISEEAFVYCEYLRDVTIPYGVRIIERRAFYSCDHLNITIPGSVTTIGPGAFSGCLFLNKYSLTLPEGLKTIESSAFSGCEYLYYVNLPASLEYIADSAFSGCMINKIIVNDKSSYFCNDEYGSLYDINQTRLIRACDEYCTTYNIPETVKNIDPYAFYYCTKLKNITIPEGVTSIRYLTFFNCKSLVNITIPVGVTSVEDRAFGYCDVLKSVIIPDSVTSIGNGIFSPNFVSSLQHVGYTGTKEQWDKIDIGENNNYLLQVKTLHTEFNHQTDMLENISPSTCLNEGLKTNVCSCGYTYSTETLPLVGCSFTAYTSDNNSTCIDDGTKTAYCDYDCGKVDTKLDIGSKLQHKYTGVITTAPTHLAEGVETFTCTCGESYTKPVAKLEGHTYTSELTKEATHLEEGETTYTCACGDSYTEARAKLKAHTYEEVVTAPTCTAKGYTTYTCACGDTYISNYIGMIAHNYSSSITTPATHLTEGVKTYTCSDCGNGYTEKIAKTPQHTYITSKVTKPSCTDKGYTSHYCECGDSYNDNYTSATGHKYNGQTCVNCGKKCSCNCHKSGFMGFIWKIILFFNKLFKTNKTCACGVSHY